MVYSLWFLNCVSLFVVLGLWFMVYGLWFSVFGLCFWLCVFGFVLIVPGSWVGLTHLQLDGRATEREG